MKICQYNPSLSVLEEMCAWSVPKILGVLRAHFSYNTDKEGLYWRIFIQWSIILLNTDNILSKTGFFSSLPDIDYIYSPEWPSWDNLWFMICVNVCQTHCALKYQINMDQTLKNITEKELLVAINKMALLVASFRLLIASIIIMW